MREEKEERKITKFNLNSPNIQLLLININERM
jgi:hypothetical protein